jgi:hypothetical protein
MDDCAAGHDMHAFSISHGSPRAEGSSASAKRTPPFRFISCRTSVRHFFMACEGPLRLLGAVQNDEALPKKDRRHRASEEAMVNNHPLPGGNRNPQVEN